LASPILAKRLAIEFNFTCYLPYKLVAQNIKEERKIPQLLGQ
jgi:hypothetical protein